MKELSIISTFALFLSAIENRFLIVRLGIHFGNHTNARTSHSDYKSLSNEFELKKSVIWPSDTTNHTDDLNNQGYRLNYFDKRVKSRQIEQTSSDERINGKSMRFFHFKFWY